MGGFSGRNTLLRFFYLCSSLFQLGNELLVLPHSCLVRTYLDFFEMQFEQVVVAFAFSPSTREAEAVNLCEV